LCLSENLFDASIGKITEIKPDILFQEKEKKTNEANATSIKELQDQVAHKTKNYIKQMVSSNKRRKGMQSYDSSDSDSSSDGESWRSGIRGAGQIHILALAGINPSNSDIGFEESDT